MTSTPDPARPTLAALDGARFLAAFHIFLFHLAVPSLMGIFGFRGVERLPGWAREALVAPLATQFFVLLSGFVQGYVYLDAKASGPRLPAREYWARRAARLVPIYWFSLLLAAPLYFLAAPRGAFQAAASAVLALTMTQAWVPDYDFWWNIPAWYFSVMLLCYLAFPAIARLAGRLGARGLLAGLLLLWGLGAAPSIVYHLTDPDRLGGAAGSFAYARWLSVIKFNPLVWLPDFAAGVLAARLWLLAPGRSPAGLPEACLAAGLGLAAWGPPIPYVLLRHGALTPLFLLLVLGLAAGRGPLARLLGLGVWRPLAGASFALFALHVPLGVFLLVAVAGVPARGQPLLAHPVWAVPVVSGVLALSLAAERWVERPLRDRLRRRLAPLPSAA